MPLLTRTVSPGWAAAMPEAMVVYGRPGPTWTVAAPAGTLATASATMRIATGILFMTAPATDRPLRLRPLAQVFLDRFPVHHVAALFLLHGIGDRARVERTHVGAHGAG